MFSIKLENQLSKYLSIGIASTILVVTTFISIEPANNPKLIVLATIGMGSWGLILGNITKFYKYNKKLLGLIGIFTALSILNLISSNAPFTQTFFGVFGRDTGVLTYISLAGLLLLASSFSNPNSYKRFINAILIAGIANLIYCGIDILGPDLFGWNNIYGEILGTLGNPNFVASFLGISASMFFPFLLASSTDSKVKILILILEIIALYEIIQSKAIQGLVVFGLGLAVTIYCKIKENPKLKILNLTYITTITLLGVLVVAGILQKGPLGQLLYKKSVSLRGAYWETGFLIGQSKPLTGVGFDSYGDYYREFRSVKTVATTGPGTVTNSAHNVIIDIFASGGFPLAITYLCLLVAGGFAAITILRRKSSFDPIGVALVTGWLGYQAQSLISINQIGLAICGWVLAGSLVGYSRIVTIATSAKKSDSYEKKNHITSTGAFITAALVGFLVSMPPFVADATWRKNLRDGNGDGLIKLASQWPKDSHRIENIVFALEKNGFTDQAVVIARDSVKFNPRSYGAWKLLVQVSKSTQEEKNLGVDMLHKLDPLNPEFK